MLNENEVVNKIANYIGVDLRNIESKKLDEDNAIYAWENIRGGKHFIVSEDNSFLGASSAISFEKLLEEFRNGKRSGNLQTINTNE